MTTIPSLIAELRTIKFTSEAKVRMSVAKDLEDDFAVFKSTGDVDTLKLLNGSIARASGILGKRV